MAIGAIAACRERNIEVGGQISITVMATRSASRSPTLH